MLGTRKCSPHLPMNTSHPNSENVLVIGGGDGGVVREVLNEICDPIWEIF